MSVATASRQKSSTACPHCSGQTCLRRIPNRDGGWVCRTAAEVFGDAALSGSRRRSGVETRQVGGEPLAREASAGHLSGSVGTGETTGRRPTDRHLALIDEGRCACAACEGSLGSSQWPSWRICGDCECHWKPDTKDGRRYACVIRSSRCRRSNEEKRT